MQELVLREGWEWKRLGDICSIVGGYAFKSEDYKETGIPLLRISNVTESFVSFEKDTVFLNPNFERQYPDFKVNKGDILIALSGATTGKFSKYNYNFPALLNQRVGKVSVNNSGTIESDYIFFFLNLLKEKILTRAYGGAQPNISPKDIENYKIPVPPLPVQRQIVAVLRQAEVVKRQRQEADALTGALLQSVFYEMFGDPVGNEKGWEIKQLDEVCTLIRDGEHRTPTYIDEGIPFITAKNLVGEKITFENTDKISAKEHIEFSKRAKPDIGDLLMAKDGTIGVTKVIKEKIEFSIYVSVVLLKLNRKILDPNFLHYLLSSESVQNEIRKRSKGIALRHIHLIDLRSLKIPSPPLALQQEFARVVVEVERIRERQGESKREIEGLFEGLMFGAFTGQLRMD